MPYDAAADAIEARFLSNWTAAAPTLRTPVRFGDARVWLTRTDGTLSLTEQPSPQTVATWVWLNVQFGAGRQASLQPDPIVRVQGLIHCSIFTTKGKGRGALTEAADLIVPIFERRQFAGLSVYERQIAGPIPDPQWNGLLLRFPFDFDDVSPDA